MRALIVHYHLKPGGVTTVIRRQLSALALAGIDAAVLSGEAAPGFGGTVSVEPALGYDQPGSGSGQGDAPDPERVAAISAAIRLEADALGADTVIHAHNPTIRKNSSLLAALSDLAASGRRVVAHVHDLAEDWRPDVYSRQPYPDGLSWAAINRFDADALRAAGAGSVAFLPNPVPCPASPRAARAQPRGGAALILCPVRGIRRKNLGETVLLSLFMRPEGRVGVTLPPVNPKDVPYYDAWRETAERLGAPVTFGMGLENGLDELYARALAVLTTSIKEGFGMSFLEPASRGIPTVGRRLPRVVPDFEAEGLSFPALYRAIAVPRGFFDEDAFKRRVGAVVESAQAAFGRASPGFAASVADDVLQARGAAGPDFGRLDETAQAETLTALASGRRNRSAFLALNPFVDGWDEAASALTPPDPAVLSPWSEAAYGERLASLYRGALEAGGGAAPDKRKLLDIYLAPEAFHGVGV